MSYVFVFSTLLLTVYGQLIIKWQVLKLGPFPQHFPDKLALVSNLLINPWIISAYFAALVASFTWLLAMSKLQLSHAYPFMSLAFVLVMGFSAFLFDEPLTTRKLLGMGLLVLGLIIGSQG